MIQFNLDEPKPTPPPRRYDDYDTAEGIFYHYYCAVSETERTIALATSVPLGE